MAEEKLRKMGFWEIGKNTKKALLPTVQTLFEQAQIEARERGSKAEVTLKILVKAPDEADGRRGWGKVSFSTAIKVPRDESKEFVTEVVDGVIVGTGDSQLDILQESLQFPEFATPENISEFKRVSEQL
jgi:hypothetical protein